MITSFMPALFNVPFENLNNKYFGSQQFEFGEPPALRDRDKQKKEKGNKKKRIKREGEKMEKKKGTTYGGRGV